MKRGSCISLVRDSLTASLAFSGLLLAAATATAESRFLLAYPDHFGVIPAQTFDLEGDRVGAAHLSISLTPRETVVLEITSGVEGGARNEARAELSPVISRAQGKLLRLSKERSESFDESGRSLGLLEIDHDQGRATCTPPVGSDDSPVELDLPKNDRVANVPFNLLFLPLVHGEVERLDFQLLLCRGGARIVDFAATIADDERPALNQPFRIVEVQFRPELNPMLSWLARGFVPNLSFWFDANAGGTYLAHRMPLFSRGPEVMIVREGISPTQLEGLH